MAVREGYDVGRSLSPDYSRFQIHAQLRQLPDHPCPIGRMEAFVPQAEQAAMIVDRHGEIKARLFEDVQDTGLRIAHEGIVEDVRHLAHFIVVIWICLPDQLFRQMHGQALAVLVVLMHIGKGIADHLA